MMMNVPESSKGFIKNSCQGSVTANVFIGEPGVGKSTIASLGKDQKKLAGLLNCMPDIIVCLAAPINPIFNH